MNASHASVLSEEFISEKAMPVFKLDPLSDPRWQALVQRHPLASIFHTVGWLEALRRTYGYEPAAVTTCSPQEELTNGLVFCRVKSWMTGRRLVSLPFADHCEPLTDTADELSNLFAGLQREGEVSRCKYIEARPLRSGMGVTEFRPCTQYCFHSLNLRRTADELFRGFHKDCVQRKIRRAERESLTYEQGRSDELLTKFYDLLLLTRRRHSLPPQPLQWFQNLVHCLGDQVIVRLVRSHGQPIASTLTLAHRKTLVYKYGCSDERFHNLGGMQLLFWHTIREAKESGMVELDMGRSELSNSGLVTFKDRWGAERSNLTYFGFPAKFAANHLAAKGQSQLVSRIVSKVPDAVFMAAGRWLYRHVG